MKLAGPALMTMRSRPRLVTYDLTLPELSVANLSIAVIADLHVSAPWTSLDHISRLVDQVNGLGADVIVLGGDYLAGKSLPGRHATALQIVDRLTGLEAPLGVLAILGNHDWHDCKLAWQSGFSQNAIMEAFEPTNIRLLQNDALCLTHQSGDVWFVGFDSQRPSGRDWTSGLHRPDRAFASVPADTKAILLAHEPDYFMQGDPRAALQISGHTHGGQMNLFGWRPMTPSQFGGRFAYGHKQDRDRQLVVSGGVGFSGLPMRIGAPPEITLLQVNQTT